MTEAVIAINRFGLGGRAGDTLPDDPRRWLLNQIDTFDPSPSPIKQRPDSKQALASHIAYRSKQRERRRMRQSAEPGTADQENPAMAALDEERREIRRGIRGGYFDDVTARGLVALESGTPFMERLTHFWSNHFAVSVRKNQVRALAGPYEFEAIRPPHHRLIQQPVKSQRTSPSDADLSRSGAVNRAEQLYRRTRPHTAQSRARAQ